jgi:hypothetical protein
VTLDPLIVCSCGAPATHCLSIEYEIHGVWEASKGTTNRRMCSLCLESFDPPEMLPPRGHASGATGWRMTASRL